MKRSMMIWTALVLSALLIQGCNWLDFTTGDTDVSLTSTGQDKLRDGDYQGAIDDFTQALEKNPNNSEARWGRAKAYVRSTGFNLIALMDELSSFQTDTSDKVPLPFMNPALWPDEKANLLYKAVTTAKDDLKAIYDGPASSPELNGVTIGLDYAADLAITSLLKLRDTNGDGAIAPPDANLVVTVTNNNYDYEGATPEEWHAVASSVQDLMQTSSVVVKVLLVTVLKSNGIEVADPNHFTPQERQEIHDAFGFDAASIDDLVTGMTAFLGE